MVNGQRVVYFNAADAQGNLQIGGAPPLAATSVPVPANDKVALVLTACAMLGAAVLAIGFRGRQVATRA